ncbi:hypothetical protein F5B20DRAFT_3447 [Whalleya microplaca]|nr:hypothetical protein F5B20DRAFT_3447 [Whalleya microplaca]
MIRIHTYILEEHLILVMLKVLFKLAGCLTIAVALPTALVRDPSTSGSVRAINHLNSIDSHRKGLPQNDATSKIENIEARFSSCPSVSQLIDGDVNNSGPGVELTNADNEDRTFFVYRNSCDNIPAKYIRIRSGETRFVSLPSDFQGRITRGTEKWNLMGLARPLATWVEITVDPQGTIWGDVSLIKGCDGAATLESLDGSNLKVGFDNWVLDGAPDAAYSVKPSGTRVIAGTENTLVNILSAPRDWLAQKIGYEKVYIDDYHGNPVISSTNGRFAVTFYPGRP